MRRPLPAREMTAPLCYVCSYPPGERRLGGGGWTDRRLLAALRDGGRDVQVITVTGPEGTSTAEGFPARSAGDVPLQVRSEPLLLGRVLMRMLSSAEPYLAAKFRAFPGWREAASLLRDAARDRTVVTNGWPALLLAGAAKVQVSLHVAQNVETSIARGHAPRGLRLLGEERRLQRLERELLGRARSLAAISHADVETFRSWGLEATFLPLPLAGRRRENPPRTLGFIGKATWPPNAATLRVLMGPVREELVRRRASLPILLAGTGTEVFSDVDGVARSGWVSDEHGFFEQVGLMVVPRFGVTTGVSVKLLEASEHDVQCVTSPDVAFACSSEPPWLLAEDVRRVADAIKTYFDDPDNTALRGFVARRTTERTLRVLDELTGNLDA